MPVVPSTAGGARESAVTSLDNLVMPPPAHPLSGEAFRLAVVQKDQHLPLSMHGAAEGGWGKQMEVGGVRVARVE